MAIQSVPQVVPFLKPTEAIPQEVTQAQLAAILHLRRETKKLQAELEKAEIEVKQALETGAEVTERLANRLYGDGRGSGYCEGVLKSTKPTRTVQLDVS